jgi:thiol-disulfide isomerase/thioredoxin
MTILQALALCCALGAPANGASGGGHETVLLDFTASWCGPCRQMQPTVERLSAQGFPVRQVDVDREQALAQKHRVSGVPCFVMLVNGRETGRIVGATSYESLAGLIQKANAADATNANAATATNGNNANGGTIDPTLVERLLTATVRIHIEDGDGRSVGTGTIIDARDGEALVLTCGHIFRDSKGQGRITVDLFGQGTPQAVPARVIGYDLESDVGFLSFRPGVSVTAARIAPPGFRAQPNDPVVSIGCNHGDPATARVSKVTTIDKFLGPPNLQVAGQPVQGRSGGGLFNRDGLVIGVCNAADPEDDEGLFAALPAIQAELNQLGLSKFCLPAEALAVAPPPTFPTRMPPVGHADPHVGMVQTSSNFPATVAPPPSMTAATGMTPPSSSSFSQAEQAFAAELNNLPAGAEVVCIVRPLHDPRAKSRVVTLDHASPEFLQQLVADQRRQEARVQTSFEVPNGTAKAAETAPNSTWAPSWKQPKP